jgi:hypothetical protein
MGIGDFSVDGPRLGPGGYVPDTTARNEEFDKIKQLIFDAKNAPARPAGIGLKETNPKGRYRGRQDSLSLVADDGDDCRRARAARWNAEVRSC